MSEQQIKFMVNRIYAKDISLESPESPKIFNELKLQPKVGFNLNTSIEKIEENTFDVTLNISIKAEAEERVIYLVVFPYAMETATTLIQKSGFPPIFFAPIDFNSLYQKELASKNKN